MNSRELIHYCCEVNCEYMRLPAGALTEYQHIRKLYERLADQSLLCAGFWFRAKPCPKHEPAVDAFWHAVVAWADAFGVSVLEEPPELQDWDVTFLAPHVAFADYLRPTERRYMAPQGLHPADAIIELDIQWMKMVMQLTRKWGLVQHLKDLPAWREAQRLETELRDPDSPVRAAYLSSDLAFFAELFKPFDFKPETRKQLEDWLALARKGKA